MDELNFYRTQQFNLPNIPEIRHINEITVQPMRNALVENVEANYASEFHKQLVLWIEDYNAKLDDEHEVGIRLVSFGQTIVFHLEKMGYSNPSLIMFIGKTENGDPVELVQHVSQISVLLMKLQRRDNSKPKSPIGLHNI